MKTITFYYDFISPYAWLAWKRIPSLASRHELEPVPVLFAGLLNAAGSKGPAEIPAKRIFVWNDVVRSAHLAGYPLKGPPAHPFNPLPALRFCVACETVSERITLSQRIAAACWEEGKDIADAGVLISLAHEAELEGKRLAMRANETEVKERLKANTQTAIDCGVFGVPTFLIDGQLFWGHDRLEHVEAYLNGTLKVSSALVTDILQRPRGMDRKTV